VKKWWPILICVLLGLAVVAPAAAENGRGAVKVLGDGPDQLNIGLGFFDFDGRSDSPAAGRIEWRFGRKKYYLGPVLGILVNDDGGLFAFGGLHLDIAWRQLVFTPFSSLGAYHQGEGKDLGGALQFRSAFEVAWQHAGGGRIGVQIGHTSNANLYHSNAGENDIFLTLTHPF
jgi:hypothetical protein